MWSVQVYTSTHKACMFGAVASVHAWERIGAAICFLARRFLRIAALRYVDDFFGASRVGATWTAGRLLDILGLALGFPMDPAKQLDAAILMDVLGIETDLNWAERLVSTCVSMDKTVKWLLSLQEILRHRRLSPEEASKAAGRLSFAVTAASNRVGRAFVKPF